MRPAPAHPVAPAADYESKYQGGARAILVDAGGLLGKS